jgi:hypothetical protein
MTDTNTTISQHDRVRELVNEAMRDGIMIGVNFAADAALSIAGKCSGEPSSMLRAYAEQLREAGPKMAADATALKGEA